MKKIYYFVVACSALLVLNACSLKEDNDFDVPASQRSEENIASVEKVLKAAPNGWLMEYYGNLSFGGYNVMVKFEGETATFGSEKWGSNHAAGIAADGKVITTSSHFKLEQSMGTVLSFDEYNETFHYYSMPNNPDYTYDTAEGLSGDFEFRVMKASADSVILRGKKSNNRIVMTPIPADKTWESYITEAAETIDFMTSRSYTLAGEGYKDTTTVTVTNNGSYRCLIFTYNDSTAQKQTVAAPYIVKKDGYYFYNPVEVNGITLDGLERGTNDGIYQFRNNTQLQLESFLPTMAENLTTANWYLLHGGLGEYATPKWDAMMEKLKTAGKNKTEIKIYTATFGLTADGKLAASMSTSTDAPYQMFTVRDISEDGTQLTIRINSSSSSANRAGKDYKSKYGWSDALEAFWGRSGRTFSLSCDNQRRPTYMKLTDINEPTNVIMLYTTPMYFMEDMSYYQDK